jgi:nucleoside-diphosphate-sugar epimerase
MPTTDLKSHYEGRPVCVTGGAGFIGSHLVEELLRLGAQVTVIDDLSGSDESHPAAMLEAHPDRYRFLHASILEPKAMTDAMAGLAAGAERGRPGVVFHEAALGSVPASVEEPLRFQQVNSTGTMRVLLAAQKARAARLVYAASSSAYGDQPELPKVETQVPQPLSPYAQTKLACEHMLAVWSACYGLSTISLRYFNIFGPRQRADTAYAAVIAAFASALLADKQATIFGDGEQTRDFTSVDNVVQANLLGGACEKDLKGEVVNIGMGGQVSINELYRLMAAALGKEAQPLYADPRPGDVQHSRADISLARELIGYDPQVSVAEGLKKTMAWYRAESRPA